MKPWLRKLLGKPEPIIIETPYGPTTESARAQAEHNMRADNEIKTRVEGMLAKEYGSVAAGLAEARRRYPLAYKDED